MDHPRPPVHLSAFGECIWRAREGRSAVDSLCGSEIGTARSIRARALPFLGGQKPRAGVPGGLLSELGLRVVSLWALRVAAAWLLCGSALAQSSTDLELVIAVDVSLSMDLDEQRLQRDGYVAAFRDPEVHEAIASGPHGRVTVTYFEWAGPLTQQVIIP